MPSRSIFSMQVVRCPACRARLPVQGKEEVVTCEYCDARVQINRRSPPPSRPGPSSPPRHVANAHYSGVVWALGAVVMLVGIAGAVAWVSSASSSPSVSVVSGPLAPPARAEAVPIAEPVTVEPVTVEPVTVEPVRAEVPTAAEAEPDSKTPTAPARGSRAPARPTGPVLTVEQARAALEPKVLACMQQTKTHALLAYMGNETAGPVKVLSRSSTRVDGRLAKLGNTKLGRCMNEAGKTVRTRAVSSNYVRFELRNDAVPDPLGALPVKADRKAVESLIAAADPQVHACARKHGQEGAREVFYFSIDGPSGKAISVRGSYGSGAFRRCAEPIYRALAFPKVQQAKLEHTHHIQL